MAQLRLTDEVMRELRTAQAQEEFYDSAFGPLGSFGVRVGKAGTVSYFVIYSLNGKRKRMTLGSYPELSLGAAQRKAKDVIEEVRRGRDPAREQKRYKLSPTVSELGALFFERHASGHYVDSTLREYRRMMERELVPVWGDIKITDLSRGQALALLEQLREERRSPVMAARLGAFIRRLFRFAERNGLIEENPFADLRADSMEAHGERILADGELQSLWQALSLEEEVISSAFKIILLTGQRPGDVLGMQWQDIRFDRWIVHAAGNRKRPRGEVPLSVQSTQVLRDLRAGNSAREFVFPSKGEGHIRYIRKAAKRLAERMAESPPWSPQDLRRTVSQAVLDLGFEANVVDGLLLRKAFTPKRKRAAVEDLPGKIARASNAWGRKLYTIASPSPDAPPRNTKVVNLFS